MPTLDPGSVTSFGNCLSGTADFASCPYQGYQTPQSWIDGLMDSNMALNLLKSPPCSMSQNDAGQIQPVLNTLSNFTYDSGGSKAPFWNYVTGLFAKRSAARTAAAPNLAATAAQLARDFPQLSPQQVASRAELVELLKAMNGGY